MLWFTSIPKGVILHLYIQPKSSKTEVVGIYNNRLKIKVMSPPVDNKANEELVEFLKKKIKGRKSDFSIIKGESSRYKDILCRNITTDTISKRLYRDDH